MKAWAITSSSPPANRDGWLFHGSEGPPLRLRTLSRSASGAAAAEGAAAEGATEAARRARTTHMPSAAEAVTSDSNSGGSTPPSEARECA